MSPGTHLLHLPSGKRFVVERVNYSESAGYLRVEGTGEGHYFEGALSADYVSLPCYRLADKPAWCSTHKRYATHLLSRVGMPDQLCCNPNLGGIMVPCNL